LSKEVIVKKTGKDRFEIVTSTKPYTLIEAESGKFHSDAWIEHIEAAIADK